MKLDNSLNVLLRGGSIYRALEIEALAPYRKTTFGKILDIGGGGNTYLCANHYHTMDISPKSNPTYIADANEKWVGVSDSEYDCVFSANCLEHLINPQNFFVEAMRVLKNDGIIILLAPWMYPYHSAEKNDYWRISPDVYRIWGKTLGLEFEFTLIGERAANISNIIVCSVPTPVRWLVSVPLFYICRFVDYFTPKRFYLGVLCIGRKKKEAKENVA